MVLVTNLRLMKHSPVILVVKDPGQHGHHVVLLDVVQEQDQNHSREPEEFVDLSMMMKLRIAILTVPASILSGLTGLGVKERIPVQNRESETPQEKY